MQNKKKADIQASGAAHLGCSFWLGLAKSRDHAFLAIFLLKLFHEIFENDVHEFVALTLLARAPSNAHTQMATVSTTAKEGP